MKNLKKSLLLTLLATFSIFATVPTMLHGASAKLPKTMLWSCYDVGASGYIQASSIADAFVKKYGTRIRLTPSGTSIGRLMPVVTGQVYAGFLANELFTAVEATYEFANIEWGPQDLRVVLAHPTSITIATTKDSGIKTLADIKGKKWATFPSATAQIKEDGYLAFMNMNRDDVTWVKFPNYRAQAKSLKEGKADLAGFSLTSSHAFELESHPKGLRWLQFDPNDKEALARMQKAAPFFSIDKETVGAGLSKQNYVYVPFYRYPMVTVRADTDPDMVYQLIKALDETFSMYKDAYPPNFLWSIERAGVPPADAPFHEGAIRYLKEKGVWKAEHDKWNYDRIAHMKKVKALWDQFRDSLDKMSMKERANYRGKNFAKSWLDYRKKGLSGR
jgi:TRAP transporter TAXI family solute receptor